MMSNDLIQRQLRAARLVAGRTQQSVADGAGVQQSTISDWETGATTITLPSLRSWAAALGHDIVLLPVGGRVVIDVPPAGPGSTSLEPGPAADPVCAEYPDCREERYVRDELASVLAEEPVGKWVSGCAACNALAGPTTEDGDANG